MTTIYYQPKYNKKTRKHDVVQCQPGRAPAVVATFQTEAGATADARARNIARRELIR